MASDGGAVNQRAQPHDDLGGHGGQAKRSFNNLKERVLRILAVSERRGPDANVGGPSRWS